MKTIKITRKGVFDHKGVEVPIGTRLKVSDDFDGFANKCEVVDETAELKLETGKAEKNTELDALRARYAELGGEDAQASWGAPKFKAEISKLEKAQQ